VFLYPSKKAKPVALEDVFTPEETVRIMTLRRQFDTYPDRYKFDINYRRLEFVRWLVAHGYLDEWSGRQVDQDGEALNVPSQKYPARCA